MNEELHELVCEHIATMLWEFDPDVHVDDKVEWDPPDGSDVNLKGISTDKDGRTYVEFDAIIMGEETYQTLRARYNPPSKAHPAEYDTREREVGMIGKWYPATDKMMPEYDVDISEI